MSEAFIIEAADAQAGIVIRERSGFRFFASDQPYFLYDRQLFKTVRAAERAMRGLRGARA